MYVLIIARFYLLVNSLCNYFLLYFNNTIKQDTVCFSQPKSEIFWFAVSILKLAGLERIELPPSVSKTEMISISPKTEYIGAG